MTLCARAVVEAVVLSKGSIGPAECVSQALGLSNRFSLARLLAREGLPPLHRLTEWITVLNWIDCAERQRVSLCWMAFHSHRHPSACYRLVKKVTGCVWEEVLARGSAWALRCFLDELKGWARRRPAAVAVPPRVSARARPFGQRRPPSHPAFRFN